MTEIRAFLVTGPESSGTRLMTRLLIKNGFLGDAGHVQRWDNLVFPEPERPIVFRRSMPHGGQWPVLRDVIGVLQRKGYDVHVVVMAREWWAMTRSQVKAGHVPNEQVALHHIRQAYALIMAAVQTTGVTWYMVPYEALVLHPEAQHHILGVLGLEVVDSGYIYDGNAKWYA